MRTFLIGVIIVVALLLMLSQFFKKMKDSFRQPTVSGSGASAGDPLEKARQQRREQIEALKEQNKKLQEQRLQSYK